MRVGITDLKGQLSTYLRAAEAGAEVEVTNRGRPIARIVPIQADGLAAVRPSRRPFEVARARRYPPAGWPTTSMALLLDERQGR